MAFLHRLGLLISNFAILLLNIKLIKRDDCSFFKTLDEQVLTPLTRAALDTTPVGQIWCWVYWQSLLSSETVTWKQKGKQNLEHILYTLQISATHWHQKHLLICCSGGTFPSVWCLFCQWSKPELKHSHWVSPKPYSISWIAFSANFSVFISVFI